MNKDKVMASAQKLIQQNKLDKAIKELQKILEEDPKDIRTLLKIGELHAKLGNKDDARGSFMQVAAFYSEQGFYLKAVAVYKQILRVDPNLIDVNTKLAELYHQLGLMNDCVQQYQLVANILDRQGKTRDSLGILKKMVDLDAENVASRIKLAELYSGQGLVGDAVREFDEAAKQLKKQERGDDYVKVAERLLFHDQTRVDVAKELASEYLKRGDAKRALGKLQISFKANPRDVETLSLLAQAFKEQDQTSKSASVLRELARIHQDAGNTQEAEQTWQRVLQLAPNDADAQRALGMAAEPPPQEDFVRHEPSFVGALSAVPQTSMGAMASPAFTQQAIPAQPRMPTVPASMVAPPAEAAPAPPKRAATGLGAVQGAPQTPEGQVAKLMAETDVYVKYGLRDKAIDHVKKVFALDPDHLEAHEKLRGLYVKAGNIPAATDEVIACFRISMGRGDKQKARTFLTDLTSIQSTHPAIATMREELDGVPSQAPIAVNVLRRAPTGLNLQVPVPTDLPTRQASHDEVAVMVDPSADELPVEEVSAIRLEVSADDLAVPEQAAAVMDAAAQMPDDLAGDLGDALHGMSSSPEVDAAASAVGSENEFDEFLASGPSNPPDDAESSFASPATTDAPADELAVVPPPDDMAPSAPSSDELMVGGDVAPDLGAAAADTGGLLLDPDLPPPDGAGFDDFNSAGFQTQALDRDTVARAQQAARAAAEPPADEFIPEPAPDVYAPAAEAPESTFEQPLPEPEPEPEPEPLPEPEPEPPPPPPPPPPRPQAAAAGRAPDRKPAPAAPAKAAAPPPPPKAPPAPVHDMALDFFPDELAEADFFIQQGLYDEAKEILTTILDEVPDSPRATRMMTVATALENGEEPPPEEAPAAAAPAGGEEDGAFDLARELDDELKDMPGLPSEPTEQVSVDTVLAEFKRGVDKVIAPDDAATHHDLGIAYKEMGLLDDAIAEFERSARSPVKEADAQYMVGVCRMEKGTTAEAADAFRAALAAQIITDNQRTAASYELGVALQGMGQTSEALEAFRAVEALDKAFKDVAARIAQLVAAGAGKKPPTNGTGGTHGGRAAADAKKGKNIGYI